MPADAAPLTRPHPLRLCAIFGVIAAAVSLGATPTPVPRPPGTSALSVRMAGADSPLGDGVAFVMGGSGIPTPSAGYVDAADTFYLEPRGFTGTAQPLSTPETTDFHFDALLPSETTGAALLVEAIQHRIAGGGVDAANPVVVFGYSQSSALSTLAMHQLSAAGVPSDDVHFVLVGDSAAPNGGYLANFATGPQLGYPTPDLYPTDVYTIEYDGFADYPRYKADELAVLNAHAGRVFAHLAYLGLSHQQIANAIPLETTGDTLTHYYLIPSDGLPLLDPIRLLPVVGNPLADLLQPDLTVLVNLGYGNITQGWNPGPANVPTPPETSLPNLNWSDVFTALGNGVPQGIWAAIRDLFNPATYLTLDSPALSALLTAGYRVGSLDTPPPSGAPDLADTAMHPTALDGVPPALGDGLFG